MSEDGVWRTISGRKVFIKDGQSLTDAMKDSGKFGESDETLDAKDMAKSFNMRGISKAYREEIEEELNRIHEQYPVELEDVDFKTTTKSSILGQAQMGFRAVESSDGTIRIDRYDTILLNSLAHKDKEMSGGKHFRNSLSRGGLLKGEDKTTLWHEYAHLIDNKHWFKTDSVGKEVMGKMPFVTKDRDEFNSFVPKVKTTMNNYRDGERMSNIVYDKMYGIMKEKSGGSYSKSDFKDDVKTNFGGYATTSKSEFLAEGFATVNLIKESTHNDFTRTFAEVFNNEFNKVFKGGK